MSKSKLQIRLEKHRKKEECKKLIKSTIKGTLKSSTVLVVSAALIAYPLQFPKTSAYFTSKIESDGKNTIKFVFENIDANMNIDHGEEGLDIKISNLPNEVNGFSIEYVELFCESQTKVFYGPGENIDGKIDLFLSWEEIDGLFDDIDDDENEVYVELIGKGTNDTNSFFLKGTSSNEVINELSIKEETELVSALSGENQMAMMDADSKENKAITLFYYVEDQNGKPIRDVHWRIEESDLGVEINSKTGEVTISPSLREGIFTINAFYRNILGRIVSDSFIVNIEDYIEELEEELIVTYIDIFGSYEIDIPEDGEYFESYDAIVADQESNVMKDESVTWSIRGNARGVTIDEKTGLLIITSDAKEGIVTIVATSCSNGDVSEEFEIDLFAPEIVVVEELEEELEEEELLEVPEDMLREEDLEESEEEEEFDEEPEDGENEENSDELDVSEEDSQEDDELDDADDNDEDEIEEPDEDDEDDGDIDEEQENENQDDNAHNDDDQDNNEPDEDNGNGDDTSEEDDDVDEDWEDDDEIDEIEGKNEDDPDDETDEDDNNGDETEENDYDDNDDQEGKNEDDDQDDEDKDDGKIDDGNDTDGEDDGDDIDDEEGKEEDDEIDEGDQNDDDENDEEESRKKEELGNEDPGTGDSEESGSDGSGSVEGNTDSSDTMQDSLEKSSRTMNYTRLEEASIE